ncbi:MAG: hypothetical protein JWQ09_1918 [Segetibacter sp.]|nr:hypothetical protein [Segetibacter sp.]
MKSLIIGIARTGSPNDYVLNPDNKYISMCGNKPEVSFSINCGQHQFIEVVNGLRYDDADPSSSADAISFFQDLITRVFADIKYLQIDEKDFTPLHIRLVTTPFELAQLPFEFVLAPANITSGQRIPLLTHPERKIALTREVRQESEVWYMWPSKPRILFAWAQPGGSEMAVPHEEHFAALKSIVAPKAKPKKDQPNPEPFIGELLTELPNASLQAIKSKMEEGISGGAPYTHLHILAHGGEKSVFGVTEFQLILCKDGTTDTPKKIDGKTLAQALVPAGSSLFPTVISLSVCDSGNIGNTILPAGSLVYQLHTSGIPCVFASQFPLTQHGSTKLVETLYQQLVNACDPRMALYETRMKLKQEDTHDWASLVAYARFPEDINEQLQAASLKNLFGSMKVTNAWVDHVFKLWEKIDASNKEAALDELGKRLTKSIEDLSAFLNPANSMESTLANELLQAEHLGLLGSAYKRKAEHFFRLRDFYPEKELELNNQSKEALNKAKEYYSCGLEANPASHWTSMQYLSLKAVTEGTLRNDNDLWYVTKRMAERDEKKASNEVDRTWAWGTLSELYLLRFLTVRKEALNEEFASALAVAKAYMSKMAATGAEHKGEKESTARQFERYIHWWPVLYPETYPEQLKEAAIEIRGLLPSLDELLELPCG